MLRIMLGFALLVLWTIIMFAGLTIYVVQMPPRGGVADSNRIADIGAKIWLGGIVLIVAMLVFWPRADSASSPTDAQKSSGVWKRLLTFVLFCVSVACVSLCGWGMWQHKKEENACREILAKHQKQLDKIESDRRFLHKVGGPEGYMSGLAAGQFELLRATEQAMIDACDALGKELEVEFRQAGISDSTADRCWLDYWQERYAKDKLVVKMPAWRPRIRTGP
jgi:hypothetical protein